MTLNSLGADIDMAVVVRMTVV